MQVIDVRAPGYARQFDQDCQERNCAIISGYNPKIDGLTAVVNELTGRFLQLPDAVLGKYKGNQRGTTYDIKKRDVDGTPFYEIRRHLMVGDELADDNPLAAFRNFGERKPNIQIEEAEFEGLIPLTVELCREIEREKIKLLKDLAASMGLPSGYWAARYAWGDHAVRTLLYEAIEGTLTESAVDGLNIYGTIINGVNVHAGLHRGEERHNMIRASPHKDIDTFAALLKATQPGFVMQQRDGSLLRYTATEGSMLLNAGRLMEHETAYLDDNGEVQSRWQAGAHWVEIANQLEPRILTVLFGHFRESDPIRAMDRDPRVLADFPDTFELLKLKKTLTERGGYFDPNKTAEELETAQRAVEALPCRDVFKALIQYEKDKGLANSGQDRLSEFEDQQEELFELWGV